MSKIIGFILLFSFVYTEALADTLTVKLDGTGDYTTIQNAIGWSSSGDVILVYPGTYYENIDCYARDSLTIASLYLLNPVDSMIHITIINGNQSGSCISAFRGENNLRVIGFTIKNGLGLTKGGGIYLKDVTVSIENCIIQENIAASGGGVFINNSSVFLSKSKICYNHAYGNGGGITNGGYELIFDTINLCDIYLNTSKSGSDYFQYSSTPVHPIVVDTATVLEPDHYYFECSSNNGPKSCTLEYEINHAKIQDVDGDIYVSPNGNDENSGLSIDEALKTISFALLKIKSNSLQSNTIHLTNGIYSFLDGNKFPIGLKDHVPIIGESEENTIINLDSLISFGFGDTGTEEITLKNLTIKNGKDSLYATPFILYIRNSNNVFLDKISLINCSAKDNSYVLKVDGCDTLIIHNSTFKENHMATCIRITGGSDDLPRYSELISCKIQNNYPGPLQTYDDYGMGLSIINGMGSSNYMTARLINCQITDNFDGTTDPAFPATSGVAFSYHTIANVLNSTIGNNTSSNPISGAVGVANHSTVNFYNSIISGNNVNQIVMYTTYQDMDCLVSIYNTLVEDGEMGILNLSPFSTYYIDSTCISEDPFWAGAGEFPYALSNNSPCINSGTILLPEDIILPDTDLMGSPRISGGAVDMGAYEFLFVGMNENHAPINNIPVKVFPNPFRDELSISFDKAVFGKRVEINLYDLQGNPVESIFNGKIKNETLICVPRGKDNVISQGVYLLHLKIDSYDTDTIKLIKI